MTYCKIEQPCKINASPSPSISKCPELCSIVKHFKKNFGRKQPDTMVGEVLKWSAKIAGIEEKVVTKAITTISRNKISSSSVKRFLGPIGIALDLIDSDDIGHTSDSIKSEIDSLLYYLGEPHSNYNTQKIYKSLENLNYTVKAIITERSWSDDKPECYKGLQTFVNDINKAVKAELQNRGPKIKASPLT